MTRLWDRGEPLDSVVARLTVGRDPELDLHLVAHDALGSAAHATMLASIGVIEKAELRALRAELRAIASDARTGDFTIEPEQEDCHTAIENRLTEVCGDAGRRVHTGRSRNDQVIAAVRLWGREQLLSHAEAALATIEALLGRAAQHAETSLPGYSHTRQAMSTTLGHWLAAHAESLLDDLPWLERAYEHLNRSPLGSASGFGVALPLDRRQVADLLGFRSVQVNTLAVQNDRGKAEWLALGTATAIATDLGRLSDDLIWLSTEELGCVRLPEALTTGSSIMPQKRNPDVLELVRAGAARLRTRHSEIAAVFAPLGSGYHRDLQLTKGPFLEGMLETSDLLQAITAVIAGLEVDVDRCRQLVGRGAAATDALYERVAAGVPFRTAYREIAQQPDAAVEGDPSESWRSRRHLGAPGALEPQEYQSALARWRSWLEGERDRVGNVWSWFSAD